MKRALYLILSVLMCLGCSVPVLATSDEAITQVVVSDEAKSVEKDGVVFTREDVPSSIAVCDASFGNKPQDRNLSTLEVQNTKSTYWDVKGWSVPAGYLAAKPYGSSAHMKDGKVLLTWHYTRTYLSDLFKYGDSERQWGGDESDGGIVVAEGSACDQDIWDLYVHHVYYGTED